MFVIDRLLHRATGEQRRYSTLLGSLLVLFFAYPVMSKLGLTRFWSLLFVAELLLAVYAISEGKKTLMIAFALVAPAVLGELSFFLFENQGTHWFAFVSVTIFLAYVSAVVYRTSIFGPGRITTDRVAGAISVYFLLGLLWALVYGMVSAVDPDAFKGLFRDYYQYLAAGDYSAPEPFPSFEEGHREIALCEAIQTSWHEERWVSLQ